VKYSCVGLLSFITLRVSRRRREMYTGHGRLCVCVSLAAFAHYCTDPGVTWGMVGVPLVVRCWADMQSVHGFRCYDNIAPNAKCQRVLVLAMWFYMQAYFMYYKKCFSVLLLSALYKHGLTCCISSWSWLCYSVHYSALSNDNSSLHKGKFRQVAISPK